MSCEHTIHMKRVMWLFVKYCPKNKVLIQNRTAKASMLASDALIQLASAELVSVNST